jgi:hypothetical protein
VNVIKKYIWVNTYKISTTYLYSSPNIVKMIRRMRWVEHVESTGEGRGVYSVLAERPEGKRPLVRPRCR